MDPQVEKALRAETVSALVALSAAYTMTAGHRPQKHWQRFEQRLRQSLSGVSSMGQWQEKMRAALGITSMSSSLCSALESLDRCLTEHSVRFSRWLWLVRSESAWFLVQLRLESEAKREARAAADATAKEVKKAEKKRGSALLEETCDQSSIHSS